MASARIEELLEQLVIQNFEVIERLDELVFQAREIRTELNADVFNTFAQVVRDGLNQIGQ